MFFSALNFPFSVFPTRYYVTTKSDIGDLIPLWLSCFVFLVPNTSELFDFPSFDFEHTC